VSRFEADVAEQGGYLYSTTDQLSCLMSNGRMSEAILAFAKPAGRRVIDIGCGDGIYSLELLDAGASEVLGVDAAEQAVQSARQRCAERPNARFETVDIYDLAVEDGPFDVAVVRGMLHHLYDAPRAIERICSVAREVVVCEPNGYNPVLKVIEKVSPYHVAHEEKSYAPRSLDRWFEACGAQVEERDFIGLVPIFCPDGFARLCKTVEPWVEGLPGLRQLACAQYMQRIRTALG
jgi:2-polyprenyl-3-methyl-5-hydroxy-6-metoxy-1,4-benzoquinol methylase